MSGVAKGFNLGGVMMAIFIFFITGIFSWFGATTLDNQKQSIQTVEVLKQLNITLKTINKNIEYLNTKVELVGKKEIENEKKLYKLFLSMERAEQHIGLAK